MREVGSGERYSGGMQMSSDQTPRMFGEVFEDGQFRGHIAKAEQLPNDVIDVGDYVLWSLDGNEDIGIGCRTTGEMGIFKVADLEPYIKAFFGLNF